MHGKNLSIYCGANKADLKSNLSIYYLKATYICHTQRESGGIKL